MRKFHTPCLHPARHAAPTPLIYNDLSSIFSLNLLSLILPLRRGCEIFPPHTACFLAFSLPALRRHVVRPLLPPFPHLAIPSLACDSCVRPFRRVASLGLVLSRLLFTSYFILFLGFCRLITRFVVLSPRTFASFLRSTLLAALRPRFVRLLLSLGSSLP